ncbi:ribosomal protein L25, Ctc-form [Luminiphilus syltensis NOR5-1B]|uniref:Large ribosomal subunit protein bL25 n=2 Tax=Luminiphilus TaxID=1341118 RepID=B8KRB2_9GAMM|nr:ribosomal protein L25, Ctc-form [Luminiphilus syltensis NOR5-1B]
MPAVVYGTDKEPTSITLIRKDFEKMLEAETFYTAIIDIDVEGTHESVILKDLQRHPAKGFPMHADFLRINADTELKVAIPIHFMNEDTCVGVKVNGGVIQRQETDIEVSCLPRNIPEYIEVDMAALDIGDSIHLTDVTLPEGVVSTALEFGELTDLMIVSVVAPRMEAEIEEEDAAAAEDAAEDTDSGDDAEESTEDGED